MDAPKVLVTKGPTPTDEEMAAIMAAVQVVMTSTAAPAAPPELDGSPRWRFSGRWWSRPVASRRVRPSF
jgi:Acyl-CoA carboxylase epsilon subunit